jgi:hypothetical protein
MALKMKGHVLPTAIRTSFVMNVWLLCLSCIAASCSSSEHGVRNTRSPDDLFRVTEILAIPNGVDLSRPFAVRSESHSLWLFPSQLLTLDTLQLYHLGASANNTTVLSLPAPDDSTIDRRGSFKDFAITNDRIYVLFFKCLLVYNRPSSGSVCRLRHALPIDRVYFGLRLLDDGCYLSASTIAFPEERKTWLAKISRNGDSLLWERSLPDPAGIEYTYFAPRRVMDIGESCVAVSDIPRYRINIYSLDGTWQTSLTRTLSGWMDYDSSISRNFGKGGNPKEEINKLRKSAYGEPNIRLVTFLNDSTLLVTVQLPAKYENGLLKGTYHTTHDIWERQGTVWKLSMMDIPEYNPALTDSWKTKRQMPLKFEYSSDGCGGLVQAASLPPSAFVSGTYSEIQSRGEAWALDNAQAYTLLWFDIRDVPGSGEANSTSQ